MVSILTSESQISRFPQDLQFPPTSLCFCQMLTSAAGEVTSRSLFGSPLTTWWKLEIRFPFLLVPGWVTSSQGWNLSNKLSGSSRGPLGLELLSEFLDITCPIGPGYHGGCHLFVQKSAGKIPKDQPWKPANFACAAKIDFHLNRPQGKGEVETKPLWVRSKVDFYPVVPAHCELLAVIVVQWAAGTRLLEPHTCTRFRPVNLIVPCIPSVAFTWDGQYSHLCHHFSAAHPLGFWWKKLQGRHRPFPSLDIAKDSSFQAIHRHSTFPGCIHYITQSHLDFLGSKWSTSWLKVTSWRLLGTPKPLKNALVSLPGPFCNNLLFTCSVHIDKCDTLWYSMIFEQWIKVN